jgi:hypothetical protein
VGALAFLVVDVVYRLVEGVGVVASCLPWEGEVVASYIYIRYGFVFIV